ncbi:P-loop containing nucleoside triphosphate hydrolase protein [Lobosporangium transversale]|uniref:p-loop containing nucleoside triphosphate hydrolase protein n=1 Tax=Lobosporangium transversale TaxID=64571 RepID=A0A1Y2G6W1_9FUNG|nr:P-loop containing nucleoside triphosphate hydrolase protein [Lobosporangium transversale]ORY99506.1 P-loop containing nucleoside triphosphate hydrolase protein [Lobosporangium transversale]|eukprot:XP_021875832.1 P-loop containing nucleoside triphosphate hydrolase protein [Lobosporangium transversale]
MTQLTSATVKIKHAGKYVLSQGIRALPQEWSTSTLEGQSLNQVSAYLFPFGLSFLLPTFVSILVQEKEDRHRIMMAMNGLKASSYYLSHYVEFIAMQLILSLVFCLTCVAISSQFILRTNPIIVIFLLVLWAHIQTTLAFLLATFFSRTRRAVLVVYFFVAFSCIMTSVSDQIFQDGKPFAWFIHPSFSFFNILSVGITSSSRINGLYPLKWRDFAVGTTLFNCVVLMIGESIIFVLLTFYIDAVAPTEYGVQKPWHFPVSFFFKRRDTPQIQSIESQLATHQEASYHGAAEGDQDILEGADADVYAERERVRSYYDPAKAPLIIQNLFHRYPGKVDPALKGLSFGLEPNTVLGLLGPNGAGKSTLIHLLTGLYQPTSGTAYVAGASIRTDMPTIHSKIGVCPQHDILWGDLTVADHLLFYARLHGIPPHLEQQAVAFAIASVSLTSFRDRQVKGLSGGEKRRVSIAISLLGDNAVILMDEPSTGLDPAVRRVIWDIVNRVKANRTIVLTTHSMEEADILSDRIAIMTSGRLRCIGTSLHLKELYGSGFRLNISSKPGKLQEACESIELKVLKSFKYTRVDKFTNASTYEIELLNQDQEYVNGHGQLSKIFSYLSRPDQFPAIEDWGLSQTTLEDVFIKIVTDGDAALAMPTIVS